VERSFFDKETVEPDWSSLPKRSTDAPTCDSSNDTEDGMTADWCN